MSGHLNRFKPIALPRVLAITSELPWPLNTGGHIRTFHLMRAMAHRFNLRVVTAVTDDEVGLTSRLASEGITVVPALTAPRRWFSEAHRAATAALAGEPYVMFHRHNRSSLRAAVRTALEQEPADLVYLDHLDPYALRPLFAHAPIVVDMHNRYGLLARRVAQEHRGVRSWYLRHQAQLLEGVERRAVNDATAVIAVSVEEQSVFERLGARHVSLVPNGVDCSRYRHLPAGREPRPPVMLYLGALSWPPNAAAADFLARKVIPEVRRLRPDATLRLVGRNPGSSVQALHGLPGVEVHANVPDVETFLADATVMTVPLDAGGGTRLKILEAFAAGLPVISTPLGVEGIEVEHGAHLVIADRDEFAAAVLDVVARPDAARDRAVAARALVERHFDWGVVGTLACAAVERALDT